MRIAVVHGYFLRGTGSNLFVANLCRELCLQGHEVQLICQEQRAEDWAFVGDVAELADDNLSFSLRFSRPGACRCYRPNLAGRLPVYVYDDYDGYEVKTFFEMERMEIEDYLARNEQALRTIWQTEPPDLVISNHTIMQPVYVSRALGGFKKVPHFAVIHGSCLNFSIRRSSLLREYALETIDNVAGLVFVSRYSQTEFQTFFSERPDLGAKSRIIAPGVDVEKFQPLNNERDKWSKLERVADHLLTHGAAGDDAMRDIWQPNAAAASLLCKAAVFEAPLILYYGKYLWTKGVHLPIAALPLVLAEQPQTRLILTGFGALRPYLEKLTASLDDGNKAEFIRLLSALEHEAPDADPDANRYVQGLLVALDEETFARRYFAAALGKMRDRVVFTGFLPHEVLADLIAVADITLAPSIFPEAFGLVAIEALASGIIPMQTNHSAFSEIIDMYKQLFRHLFPQGGLRRLLLNEELTLNMANNMKLFLRLYASLDDVQRSEIRRQARASALPFSWSNMASCYAALAGGTAE